jgi:hypothetical protein
MRQESEISKKESQGGPRAQALLLQAARQLHCANVLRARRAIRDSVQQKRGLHWPSTVGKCLPTGQRLATVANARVQQGSLGSLTPKSVDERAIRQ